MTDENLNKKLIKIFEHRLQINFNKKRELKDKNIFGYSINAPVRELVMILFDIEKEFSISIPHEFITKNKFFTFNDIEFVVKKICK